MLQVSLEPVVYIAITITHDVDNATSEALLPQIVILYVTIQEFAFAFAGRWMEALKQSSKKSLQRSKSLRNKLQANEPDN